MAEEVRSLLSHGVADLVHANPMNYFRSADQVVSNLEAAFRKHERSLLEAKQKKLSLYGIDVSSCLAVGGIGIAAAITQSPLLGAIAGITGVLGLPTLKDVVTKYKNIVAEEQTRLTSPTGILFKHLKH